MLPQATKPIAVRATSAGCAHQIIPCKIFLFDKQKTVGYNAEHCKT